MPVSIDTVANIATAISAIAASASAVAVFAIYKVGRRDDKLKIIRQNIVEAKLEADELDQNFGIDLISSMIGKIIEGYSINGFLLEIYDSHISKTPLSSKEFEDYIKDNIPMVVGSFQCQESQEFEAGLRKLASLATSIEFDFPGLSRLIYSVRNVLRNSYSIQRKIFLDADLWESAINQIYEEQVKNKFIFSYESFISKLFRLFVGSSLSILKENGQENINDTIQSLNIVVDQYLEKTPTELLKSSKDEKEAKTTPLQDDKTIVNNLRQAETCFSNTISKDSLLMLRQLSSQIEAR